MNKHGFTLLKSGITVCLLSLSFFNTIFAENIQPTINVLATKQMLPIRKSAQAIQIISHEQLKESGISTIKELFDTVSNVSMSNTAGQKSIFFRGLPSNAYKMIIDGVEMSNPLSPNGAPYLDALVLDDIYQIDIISGSSGVLYGSSATGGVIHITTWGRKKENSTAVDLRFGDNQYQSNVRYNHNFNKSTRAYISAHRSFSEIQSHLINTTEKDAEHTKRVSIQLHKNIGQTTLNLSYNNSQSNYELDSPPKLDDPNYILKNEQELSYIELSRSFSPYWTSTLRYSINHLERKNQNPTDNINPNPNVGDFSSYNSIATKIDWLNTLNIGRLQSTMGIEKRSQRGTVNKGWDPLPNKGQSTHSFYMNHVLPFSRFTLELGGRLDDADSFSNGPVSYKKGVYTASLSTELGLGYVLNLNTRSGYRIPTLYELFSIKYGNKGLRPEEIFSKEVSIKHYNHISEYGLSFFENDIIDKITGIASNGFKYDNSNQNIRSFGGNFFFQLQPIQMIRYIRLDYTSLISKTGDTRSLRVADKKASISASIKVKKLSMSPQFIFIGSRLDVGNITLPSYHLIHLNIRYAISKHENIYLYIHNLGDTKYNDIAGYNSPKRQISIGYSSQF